MAERCQARPCEASLGDGLDSGHPGAVLRGRGLAVPSSYEVGATRCQRVGK